MTINLSNSYEEFISQFPVYDSVYTARAKGFEAHHIYPVAVQTREKGRVCDNRCVRLTRFQHILAHYLYCKEHPEDREEFAAFNCMVDTRAKEMLKDERLLLKELPGIAEITAQGRIEHSKAMKGENNPMYGRHHSEEARRRVSEANKGKPSPRKGKHWNEETRKRMSETRKGQHLGPNNSNARCVYMRDLEGNTLRIFPTVQDACVYFNKSRASIQNYLKGKSPKNFPYILSAH